MDPIMVTTMRKLHEMIAEAGMEDRIELMEDGGLNAGNVAEFIAAGMTVGEFSSPLLKGPKGKLQPGTGEIAAAVQKLRAVMDAASDPARTACVRLGSKATRKYAESDAEAQRRRETQRNDLFSLRFSAPLRLRQFFPRAKPIGGETPHETIGIA